LAPTEHPIPAQQRKKSAQIRQNARVRARIFESLNEYTGIRAGAKLDLA